jgi:uncharacterized protein YkwD
MKRPPCTVVRVILAVCALQACGCGGVAIQVESDGGGVGQNAQSEGGSAALTSSSDGGELTGTPYPVAASGGSESEGLGRLNAYRALAELAAVEIDTALSEACRGHVQYLSWEAARQGGDRCFLAHDETNTANPYYSQQRAAAGMGALLACVPAASGGLSTARAVDRWIGSLYHRIPLLAPTLRRVGIAQDSGYVCLHYSDGTEPISETQLVVWPPEGTREIPLGFPGRENPCPTTPDDPRATAAEQCPESGFIITATWFGPAADEGFSEVIRAQVQLDATRSSVPLLAWYADGLPGQDPAHGLIRRTVALVPSDPLVASTQLRATVRAVIDGREVARAWSFATGRRQE